MDGWLNDAACRDPKWDPNLWSSIVRGELAEAMWVCRNICTVTEECLEWAKAGPHLDTVYGGILWASGGPARTQPVPREPITYTHPEAQPLLPNLAEIRDLVKDGVSYMDIAEMFGVSTVAIKSFVMRYRRTPEWTADEK